MSESPGVTIFEAINFVRKERFIGATRLKMNELIASFSAAAPPRAALAEIVASAPAVIFLLNLEGRYLFTSRRLRNGSSED